jgi:hypothetical protein
MPKSSAQEPSQQHPGQAGHVDPRAAVYRPGDLWVGVGKPITGLGAVKIRLTPEYLIWETGTLRSDIQQVPLAYVIDVDAMQSMIQKTRGVGNIRVQVQRRTGVEVVMLVDLPEHRQGVEAINEHSRRARHAEHRFQNTHHYAGQMPPLAPQQHPAPPVVTPVAQPARPNADEIFGQIQRLGDLRDKGFITAEDFDAKKGELLARL